MRKYTLIFFVFLINVSFSQNGLEDLKSKFTLRPEFVVGHSILANDEFPKRKPQLQGILNFGWHNKNNKDEWTYWLKSPETGFSIGYTNFGNNSSLGSAISIMPHIKFKFLKNDKFSALIATGTSYFTKKFNSDNNFINQAITTDFVWSFKAFLYYDIYINNTFPFSIGLGYFHHSNGHTKLPNQGFNSFLLSLSKKIQFKTSEPNIIDKDFSPKTTKTNYYSVSFGAGINALSIPEIFNNKQPVYSLSISRGKILNNTFKIGFGAYYNFYRHYYDYISNNESLVQDGREFNYLKSYPIWNASVLGVFANGELILNHIGIDVRLGLNIFKPTYKIDRRINQGWYFFPRNFEADSGLPLGEFDTQFYLKRYISSRLGLNYYIFSTNKMPKHNFFFGIHINTNLGQADFTEMSMGYIHTFKKAEKKS